MLFYGSKHYIVDLQQQAYAQFVCFDLKARTQPLALGMRQGVGNCLQILRLQFLSSVRVIFFFLA